jgi:hypothetical protein
MSTPKIIIYLVPLYVVVVVGIINLVVVSGRVQKVLVLVLVVTAGRSRTSG